MNEYELHEIEEDLEDCVANRRTFSQERMAEKYIPILIAEIRRLNKKEVTQDETQI